MMEKRDFIDMVVLLFLFFLLNVSATGLIIEYYLKETPLQKKPIELFYNENYSRVNGLSIPNVGYFVFTYGLNIRQINETHYHEACHQLVDRNYYHFCEEYHTDTRQQQST